MRFRPIGLILSGAVVASSACSMDATAPSTLAAPAAPARAAGEWQGEWSDRARDTSVETYVVRFNPTKSNVLRFGTHTLEIPANAVCDDGSGYGLQAFDQDCAAERKTVTVTAVVRSSARGIPRIDLAPEMRFNPRLTVTLSLYVSDMSAVTRMSRILYCPTRSSDDCVDEGARDPSLVTHVDAAASTVFRRIKHFSGYFVDN